MSERLMRHPANREPDYAPAEMERLVKSMRTHGFRDCVGGRVVVVDGMVAAGWHRYQAARLAGVDPVIEREPGMAADVVTELSDRLRRHRERIDALAADVAARSSMKGNEPRVAAPRVRQADVVQSRDYSRAAIAERHGYSEPTVRRMETVVESGDDGLMDRVRSDELGIKTAADLAEIDKFRAEADPERDADLIEDLVEGRRKKSAVWRIKRQRDKTPIVRPHPATFSAGMMVEAAKWLTGTERVLDPFAGAGGIFDLLQLHPQLRISAVDIEPAGTWSDMDPRVEEGDATSLRWPAGSFGAVITSPTYGNRMSDGPLADDAGRDTYAARAGRALDGRNTGRYRWRSPSYRALHGSAWSECRRVLDPGGLLILFLRDHMERGEPQPVTGWHANALLAAGFDLVAVWAIAAPGNRRGQHSENCCGSGEVMMIWRAPPAG